MVVNNRPYNENSGKNNILVKLFSMKYRFGGKQIGRFCARAG